jgi:hypothetical protein
MGLLELSQIILLSREVGLNLLPPVAGGAPRNSVVVVLFVQAVEASNSREDVMLRILKDIKHDRL